MTAKSRQCSNNESNINNYKCEAKFPKCCHNLHVPVYMNNTCTCRLDDKNIKMCKAFSGYQLWMEGCNAASAMISKPSSIFEKLGDEKSIKF